MTKQSNSLRGIRLLMIAVAPVILGKTAMEAQLKKWSAKIVETRAGSGRTTATTGPRYGVQRWWRLIAGVLTLALVMPGAGTAAENVSNTLNLPSLKTDWGTGHAVELASAAPVSPTLLSGSAFASNRSASLSRTVSRFSTSFLNRLSS